jgi:hypothetical protein
MLYYFALCCWFRSMIAQSLILVLILCSFCWYLQFVVLGVDCLILWLSQYSDFRLDNWGLIPGRRQRTFPLASASKPGVGPTKPPVLIGTGGPFQGSKVWPRHYIDYFTPI